MSFEDMMIEDGFSDPQDYMDYLEQKAMDDYYNQDYYEPPYSDYEDDEEAEADDWY